ncbi:MAG: 50S ribosomal protein L6 [Sedimentisphaerales bacterium]|nr:50S ribosomal protein L6 [Sedimentisphaerales bacterium]
MSRIGKKPVKVPSGVKIEIKGRHLTVGGTLANLTFDIHPDIDVEYDSQADEIRVSRSSDMRFHRSLHGTTRAIIANMIEGVTRGFQKKIEVYGTGYGVKVQGMELQLSVGYAQPVRLTIPEGITVDIATPNARGNETPAVFTVNGADKHAVGQFAADIRRSRPPEPYLGKGVRFADEVIKKKVGKAFASSG